MLDETIRQKSSDGTPLAQVLSNQGILPGIKVDTGAKPLAGSLDETVTEGLDGLRDRLREYHGMGARFAKWRAIIISQTVCRASPVSMRMRMRWRATPRFVRNSI
jgi:fructose-bisphosphate aldolase class I